VYVKIKSTYRPVCVAEAPVLVAELVNPGQDLLQRDPRSGLHRRNSEQLVNHMPCSYDFLRYRVTVHTWIDAIHWSALLQKRGEEAPATYDHAEG
jgi:hypothetical protein